MSHLGNSLEIRHIVSRVANALDIHSLGLVINSSSDLLWILAIYKLGIDTKTRQKDLELVIRASVEVGRGNNIVARVRKGVDGNELRALAGRGCQSCDTAFQGCDALFKDVYRWLRACVSTYQFKHLWPGKPCTYIHDAAVDVAKLLEAKEPRSVRRVIECVALCNSL